MYIRWIKALTHTVINDYDDDDDDDDSSWDNLWKVVEIFAFMCVIDLFMHIQLINF